MANPIYNTTSFSKIVTYLTYARDCLSKNEPLFLVGALTGGSEHFEVEHNPMQIEVQEAIKMLEREIKDPPPNLSIYKEKIKNIVLPYRSPKNVQMTVGNIAKSTDKIPLGYLAEAIFQAALVVRFTKKRDIMKSHTVTQEDVIAELKRVMTHSNVTIPGLSIPKKTTQNVKTSVHHIKNHDPNIKDDVLYVLYTLNDSCYKWLEKTLRNNMLMGHSDVSSIINDSVQYANTLAVQSYASYFHTNGMRDRIDILAYGVLGQVEKVKEDVKIQTYADWDGTSGRRTLALDMDISLKIRKIEQVAQVSGIQAENIKELMETLGFNFQPIQDNPVWAELQADIAKSKTAHGNNITIRKKIYKLYGEEMVRQASRVGVRGFINGIRRMINAGNNKMILVNIGGGLGVYYTAHIDQFIERYAQGGSLKCMMSEGEGSIKLEFDINHGGSVYPILRLHSRYTGGINRNFISVINGSSFKQFLEQSTL